MKLKDTMKNSAVLPSDGDVPDSDAISTPMPWTVMGMARLNVSGNFVRLCYDMYLDDRTVTAGGYFKLTRAHK